MNIGDRASKIQTDFYFFFLFFAPGFSEGVSRKGGTWEGERGSTALHKQYYNPQEGRLKRGEGKLIYRSECMVLWMDH